MNYSNELNVFVNPLKSMNPDLMFLFEYDHKCVSFLDMQTELCKGSFIPTLYQTEMNRNTFPLASNAHHRAMKYDLPLS